jgi:hypothetical protein
VTKHCHGRFSTFLNFFENDRGAQRAQAFFERSFPAIIRMCRFAAFAPIWIWAAVSGEGRFLLS